MALGSCSQDRDPVYHDPTPGSLVLYKPAMADQYIELSENGTLNFTTAGQPDYGYSAVANYSVQIAISENGFDNEADFREITPIDPHQSAIVVKQFDVAYAILEILGIETQEDFDAVFQDGEMPYTTYYFRAVCQLEGVPSSLIYSNVESYNYLKGYLAIPQPGKIWLVGTPNGWNNAPGDDWALVETAAGTGVYTGIFNIPSADGGVYFRYYTEQGNWGKDGELPSIGPLPNDDTNIPVEWEEEDGTWSFTSEAVPGKGSWHFPDWEGGMMTLVLDMSDTNNMVATFYQGEVEIGVADYVYMVGNNGGWATPDETSAETYNKWRLADSAGTGIYSATFNFADFAADGGTLYCRFYKELSGWGAAQWSSSTNASDNIPATSGVALPTFVGEGCFTMDVAGHKVNVVLDTNQDQVTFTYAD